MCHSCSTLQGACELYSDTDITSFSIVRSLQISSVNAETVKKFCEAFESAPKPVLVHCGASKRAAAMILLQQATQNKETPEQFQQRLQAAGIDFSSLPKLKQFMEEYMQQQHQQRQGREEWQQHQQQQ